MNQVSSFQYNPKGVSQKVPERFSQFTVLKDINLMLR